MAGWPSPWAATRRIAKARRAAVLAGAGYLISPIDLVPGHHPGPRPAGRPARGPARAQGRARRAGADAATAHLAAVGLAEDDLAADVRTVGVDDGLGRPAGRPARCARGDGRGQGRRAGRRSPRAGPVASARVGRTVSALAARRERPCVAFGHALAQGDPRDRRPRDLDLQPAEGLLPGRRLHQARRRPLLPGRRRWRAGRGARPADGPQALRRRHRQGAVLPEAGTRQHARLDAHGRADLPVRPDRRRDRRRRRGRAGLDRQPRLHRPQPAPGPRRRPRPPRRAARRPGPDPGRALVADPRRGDGLPGGPRGGRPGRLAQDVRLARHPHQRAHRAALDVPGGPPGGPGPGPRRRAPDARTRPPRSGGRRSASASSSTTTRTPRTGRSRRPTRSGRCPTPASRRR